MALQAFNNDKEFRDAMIASSISHQEKDEYIAGTYAKMSGSFKGCSVGCSLFDIKSIKGVEVGEGFNDHALLARELGLPEFICHLQDSIFEGLPDEQRYGWTARLFEAIPLGADLTPVLPRFLLKTLGRLPETDRADVVAAIAGVREVLQNWADTGTVDLSAARAAAESAAWSARSAARSAESAWSAAAARSAAWSAESAARSAARSAAWSAESAESAARSAARSAESAARSAARAAAESAEWSAESAAWSAAWEQIANDLIECIEDCARPIQG